MSNTLNVEQSAKLVEILELSAEMHKSLRESEAEVVALKAQLADMTEVKNDFRAAWRVSRAEVTKLKAQMIDMTSVASAINYINKRELSFPLAQ